MYGLIDLFYLLGIAVVRILSFGWVTASWDGHASADRVYVDRKWDGTIVLHTDLAAFIGIVLIAVFLTGGTYLYAHPELWSFPV